MRLCYDIKLMRPGCVLLAAAMGGDTALSEQFNSDHWIIAPTPDLKVYETTPEQFNDVLAKTEKIHGNRRLPK
jgi:hypothetical protein